MKKIVRELLPNNTGAIIRTEAKWKNKTELQIDLQEILKKWSNIRSKINKDNIVPYAIYENISLLDKIITNLTYSNIEKVITDNIVEFEKYKNKINIIYQKNFEITSEINKQISISKKNKVWLDSGACITIDKTEALIAIDVNSARYIGKKSVEETFFKVNMEATIEIAKQIRLRNLGGMILIDYINMEDPIHKTEILQLLREEIKKDRSKVEIFGFTKLNLLEMVRQHING